MYTYAINADAQLVVVRFEAGTKAADILGFFVELEADPAYAHTMDGLVDLRGIELEISLEDVRELAEHVISRGLKSGRWAVYVDQPKATALAMLYTKAVDAQYSFQVFSTAAGISSHLGINASDYLRPSAQRPA